MNIVLRRALLRDLGQWATEPVWKIGGIIFELIFATAALWTMKFLLDAGSILAAFEKLKTFLGLRFPSVIS